MLATVCLLAMTGVSFVPDWQLESDRVNGVIVGGGKTTVLLEESGAISLRRLPEGLQERIRREFSLPEFSLDKSYPPGSAEERFQDLVERALAKQGLENRLLILPPDFGDLPVLDSVPFMPNFYRKGDPIPYIPNFFKEGDLDRYWPGFSQNPAPLQYIPLPKEWRDEQILKYLWDRSARTPLVTPFKPGDKLP